MASSIQVTAGDSEHASRDEIIAGLKPVDISANERIPILMEMVGAVSRAREPADVLRAFSAGMDRLEDHTYTGISRVLPSLTDRYNQVLKSAEDTSWAYVNRINTPI